MNILLPMAVDSGVAQEMGYPYPSPLLELTGRTIIDRVVENLREAGDGSRFIFILRDEDCVRFHLHHTVELLAPEACTVVRLKAATHGALCSALMAVSVIDNETPLLIANSDQLFGPGVLNGLLTRIRALRADAGCPYIESVHPRWSYLRIENDLVVEAAEKKPISRHAIAGLYYFTSGHAFVNAANRAILNRRQVDEKFFLSAAISELILEGRRVVGVPIDQAQYHSFFTPQRIENFQRLMAERHSRAT